MSFDERLGWLLLGVLIGAVLGYMMRYLQEILKKEEEILEVLDPEQKDETGEKKLTVGNVALFVVVLASVFAAFASQRAVNESNEAQAQLKATQEKLSVVTYCNQFVLTKALSALNERTLHSRDQLDANVELQKAQARFLRILIGPPPASPEAGREATQAYIESLTGFLAASQRSKRTAEENPYPTTMELSSCVYTNTDKPEETE